MPTVLQIQTKLKRELDTKNIIKDLEITSNGIKGRKKTRTVEMPMEVWDNPHEVLELRKEDVGKNVWIAGYPSTFVARLEAFYEAGEEMYPEGGVDLRLIDRRSARGTGSCKSCFFEEVVLHPDELDENRLWEHFTIKDGRS